MTMPATAPMPPEVAKCFEGKPGGYGRYVIASGPYMIEGSDELDISSCKSIEADQRLRRQDEAHARPEPELQREHGQPARRGRTIRTASSSPSTRTSTTSTTRSPPASSRTSTRPPRRRSSASTQTNAEQAEVPALELGRRHVLHHDEPDPAAVRRRARPPGDELGHGPACARQGLGWRRVRRGRRAHHPEPDARREARQLPAVQDGRRPRERREGEGRDGEVEVRQQRVASARRRSARACC